MRKKFIAMKSCNNLLNNKLILLQKITKGNLKQLNSSRRNQKRHARFQTY